MAAILEVLEHCLMCHVYSGSRPPTTIFEINATNKNRSFAVMRAKRRADDAYIAQHAVQMDSAKAKLVEGVSRGGVAKDAAESGMAGGAEAMDADESLTQAFSTIVAPRCELENYNNI